MKREAIIHVKKATELKAGDQIISRRMTVATITNVETSEAWRDKKAIHVTMRGPPAQGICLIEDEEVLVIE
jgi:hypothetical protein